MWKHILPRRKTMVTTMTERPVRILQFGEGNFLRCFIDWMVQRMNDRAGFDGLVRIVQPIGDALTPPSRALNARGAIHAASASSPQSATYCSTQRFSASPLCSMSSQGRKTRPGRPAAKRANCWRRENMIDIVCGGQAGDEGKGKISAYLSYKGNYDYCVRVGGPNAGHTVVKDGKSYTLKNIPSGFLNPKTKLVLGAGAYTKTEWLLDEVNFTGTKDRLIIDPYAVLITDEQTAAEKNAAV